MDPILFKPKTVNKIINDARVHLNKNISNYLYLASLLSLLIGIRSVLVYEVPIGNAIYLVQYIIAVVINTWRIFQLQNISIGKVMLYNQRKVLPNIKKQIKSDTRVLDKKTSDKNGILNFSVSPGVYKLELLDDSYRFATSESNAKNEAEVIISERGFLRNNIILKQNQNINNLDTGLMNPFQ